MAIKQKKSLDDSDLEELIAPTSAGSSNVESGVNYGANNNSKAKAKFAQFYQPEYPMPSSNVIAKIPMLVWYMCMSFMLNCPKMAKLVTLAGLGLVLFSVIALVDQGEKQSIGIVKHDFTNVKSMYDFDIGQIDHWCVDVSTTIQSLSYHSYSDYSAIHIRSTTKHDAEHQFTYTYRVLYRCLESFLSA